MRQIAVSSFHAMIPAFLYVEDSHSHNAPTAMRSLMLFADRVLESGSWEQTMAGVKTLDMRNAELPLVIARGQKDMLNLRHRYLVAFYVIYESLVEAAWSDEFQVGTPDYYLSWKIRTEHLLLSCTESLWAVIGLVYCRSDPLAVAATRDGDWCRRVFPRLIQATLGWAEHLRNIEDRVRDQADETTDVRWEDAIVGWAVILGMSQAVAIKLYDGDRGDAVSTAMDWLKKEDLI